MDRTTRWETEALRSQPTTRKTPPQPSRKQPKAPRQWVTLREAEASTGIPTNTLRKWARKDEISSYLESDGDIALRMVDLTDVRRRAKALGRSIEPRTADADEASADTDDVPEPLTSTDPETTQPETTETDQPDPPQGTMIVPIDAWNKMLNQLGNLHEAGQQLAEARERAAKAETEAVFLRDRLAEMRTEQTYAPEAPESEPADKEEEPTDPTPEASTSYWRYLTTGWRNRNR
ncbi:MAG: hypothetical protein ACR2N7_10010 [Acidimicrobiia bacterium]